MTKCKKKNVEHIGFKNIIYIKACQINTYKMKTYLKSSLWSNAATWLPASVLHAGVWLASQQSVTSINVFGFVIHCSYVKIFSCLFHRM